MTLVQDILSIENDTRIAEYGIPLSLQERAGVRNFVESLLSRAKPGNRAWHKLNQRFGLDGDVSMGDFGEPERAHEQ